MSDGVSTRMSETLLNTFEHASFRPLQEEIITSILSGKDTVVILPTGSGKSLCYQLPAVISTGLTIVFSPLISLIKDQVDALRGKNVQSAMINSAENARNVAYLLSELNSLEFPYKLLYIAPERLKNEEFMRILKSLVHFKKVSFFAIDEAHCISQWGHDFRSAFRHLNVLKEEFPAIPIIALTATATPAVSEDIISTLKLSKHNLFKSTFNRPEISYSVIYTEGTPSDVKEDVVYKVASYPKDTNIILYCFSRKACDNYSEALKSRGLKADAYHAGLPTKKRTAVQKDWTDGTINIICATIAFGMGIDKPNVRAVIHASFSTSIEGFYQESGRAARDGQPAESIVYFSYGDIGVIRFCLTKMSTTAESLQKRMQMMENSISYCKVKTCRRTFLLNYFGEQATPGLCNSTCDNCLKKSDVSTPKRIKLS